MEAGVVKRLAGEAAVVKEQRVVAERDAGAEGEWADADGNLFSSVCAARLGTLYFIFFRSARAAWG